MRIIYALLSPTFGMHQYTADYANRLATGIATVSLTTTTVASAAPYMAHIPVHTPVSTSDTGFNQIALCGALRLGVGREIAGCTLSAETFAAADVVHFSGPHLWNLPLLLHLRRAGIPTLHTLHDVAPHPGYGVRYSAALYLWNRLVAHAATHILVHGQRYKARVARWIGEERVTCIPLLHGFWGTQFSPDRVQPPPRNRQLLTSRTHPSGQDLPFALYFGRIEAYKGVDILVQSYVQAYHSQGRLRPSGGMLDSNRGTTKPPRLVIAGKGALSLIWNGPLPSGVEVRNRHIEDEEALDLFRRCAVVVLPYRKATQSALIAAAYVFCKPVIVTATGALSEYVLAGKTGWIVPPLDSGTLAQALDEALVNPAETRRRGVAGRAWYEAQRGEEWGALQGLYQRVANAL